MAGCAGTAAQALLAGLQDTSSAGVAASYTNEQGPSNPLVAAFQAEWPTYGTGTLAQDGLYGGCTAAALSAALGYTAPEWVIPDQGTGDGTCTGGPYTCTAAPVPVPPPGPSPSSPYSVQYVKTTPSWVKWLLALLAVAAVAGIGYLVFKGGDKKKLSGAGEPRRLMGKSRKGGKRKAGRRHGAGESRQEYNRAQRALKKADLAAHKADMKAERARQRLLKAEAKKK